MSEIGRKPMARPGTTVQAEDPRARAYWKFHRVGAHKVPGEGLRPDHYYACGWCKPPRSKYDLLGHDDREWEVMHLPQGTTPDFMAFVRGRLG